MTKRIVPQATDACRKLVLETLTASNGPKTLFQIRDAIQSNHKIRPSEIRASVLALTADELIDSEQLGDSLSRVFFLPHRPPRGAVLTPANQVPRIAAIAPRQWFSALGLAA
ncbi:hypothetical protein [Massilia sp. TSP1-1-2]|uniref:hypothetical protein n=1 Tax=Massilia sp. TSP1-1-2 TaxID=2804649 RepID=UPI003CFBA49D